jgi:hypothetical protein
METPSATRTKIRSDIFAPLPCILKEISAPLSET